MARYLEHFAAVVAAAGTTADPEAPGAGAAGGIGFAVLALMGGRLRPGFEMSVVPPVGDEPRTTTRPQAVGTQ